jgi:hypothetical protein
MRWYMKTGRYIFQERTVTDIIESDNVLLSKEAPRLTGICYGTLNKYAQAGRLKTYGSPKATSVKHLMHQQKNKFPKVGEAA